MLRTESRAKTLISRLISTQDWASFFSNFESYLELLGKHSKRNKFMFLKFVVREFDRAKEEIFDTFKSQKYTESIKNNKKKKRTNLLGIFIEDAEDDET